MQAKIIITQALVQSQIKFKYFSIIFEITIFLLKPNAYVIASCVNLTCILVSTNADWKKNDSYKTIYHTFPIKF